MTRTIRNDCPAVVASIPTTNLIDVKEWLQTQGATYGMRWLLAHADDGVIWGRVDNGRLIASDSIAPKISPPLRPETLQQARLFSHSAELLLWRDGDNKWHARLIREPAVGEKPTFTEAIDEPQILWGTDPQSFASDFTLMSDGGQGLCHTVPLEVSGKFDERTRPLRLWVRHYLAEDDGGFTRIIASRLFDLRMERVK